MDHKKNLASAFLDPPDVTRSDDGLKRHMRTIKNEVTKKMSSRSFLDELADYIQDKSEDLVEGKNVDDILNCETDMDAY